MKRTLIEIAAELRDLPDEELATVFHLAVADRKLTEYPWLRGQHYVMALAYQADESDDEATERWGQWQLAMITRPDPDHYSRAISGELILGEDLGFCQEGTCIECGADCCSNLKHGICPICGAKVFMT
jgi:hypothetical protein